MQKDKIFISHATPEDNLFAGWLASKLKLLGYDVWVDFEDLAGGEAFYNTIQKTIQNESIKFIAIVSDTYKMKFANSNTGVFRELTCASDIQDENFKIPLRIDGTPFTQFPILLKGINAFDFSENWQNGLIALIEDLDKQKIVRKSIDDPINLWLTAINWKGKLIERKENYYSNCFPLELPEYIYIHEPEVFNKEKYYDLQYPYIRDKKYLISFFNANTMDSFDKALGSYQVPIDIFVHNEDFIIPDQISITDTSRKLVRLLNQSFQQHLFTQKLRCWKRGGKRNNYIFFFTKNNTQSMISLKKYGKRGRSLHGYTTESIGNNTIHVNWHFGIKGKANINDSPYYRIDYTIVFTNEEDEIIDDPRIHHKLRRSFPTDWFNRKWFETLLAAILRISPSGKDDYIKICIDENNYINVRNTPFNNSSQVGYIENND